MVITKIISGGQTGVDRAALDWAIASSISHGGWCPQGRLAEDGIIDAKYHLNEIESGGYRQRTKRNVSDSDGTLILNFGDLCGGTLATHQFAKRFNKPVLVVQLDSEAARDVLVVLGWLRVNKIAKLNVAGPRESKRPSIYNLTMKFMNLLEARIVKRP